MLVRSKTFDATDKRDKAYALLGLTQDQDRKTFAVDYRQTVDEVAQRVSRYLLVQSESRDFDGRGVLYNCVGLRGSGPSWAYDLVGTATPDGVLG